MCIQQPMLLLWLCDAVTAAVSMTAFHPAAALLPARHALRFCHIVAGVLAVCIFAQLPPPQRACRAADAGRLMLMLCASCLLMVDSDSEAVYQQCEAAHSV